MKLIKERHPSIVSKLFIPLLLLFFSCEQKNKDILVDHISPSDFEDVLDVDGIVQAVQSSSLACPRGIEAEVVFLIEDGSLVEQGDTVCILESRELTNEYEQVLISVETAKANLNKSKADLDMQFALLDAQVKSIVAQTAIANLDSLQLKYSSPIQRRIKELEIQKATIEKDKLERKLKSLKVINKSQIRSLEIQILQKENQAASMKERLDMLIFKASQTGMTVRAKSWLTGKTLQEGDQVWSNMPLVSIPDLSEMKVVIQATESNYKRMKIDDPVEFTFDAMPGNRAWGKIQKIAPVGQPIKKDSKVKFFEIEASVDSSTTLPELGLTANGRVILKRVLDTIVVPQIAIFDQDSAKFVYVKLKKGYEKRQVLLGVSSPKSAVIKAGLTGKERISMIKPSSLEVKIETSLTNSTRKKTSNLIHQQNKSSKSQSVQLKQIHAK
ncbi:MAG: efflux RND transporter periplasmic adaptor subunit [Bacteroidales bacterium]|nr:efflux RND transporter periplasmic adaptor subunit [Bacteroidales bacterium]